MESALGIEAESPFARLYEQHSAEAVRLAYTLTGDRALAEDLAQEAFVRLLGRFGNLRRADSFRAYLLRTVVNLSYSHHRRLQVARRKSSRSIDFGADPATTVDERDRTRRLLAELPLRQRAAVVLRYCEDLSEHDVADILHTSPKAVRSLVGRALAALRTKEQELR